MNIIEQMKADKKQLEELIAKHVREFEDKYEVARIEAITIGRYPNPQYNNYGRTFASFSVKIQDLT